MAEIRAVRPHDAEQWRNLFLDYGVFYETAFSPAVLDGVWAWLLDPAHPVSALVATNEDGDVVGLAHYREQQDTFTAGPSYFLDDLFVDPSARGAGLAARLIAKLKEIASEHGAEQIRWITAADNTRARSLYERVARETNWVTFELDV